MTDSVKLSVVMFTGGRGTHSITTTLLKYPHVTLTLLVNTYDDGLSTGKLRTFVPGMLGPSDIRKNVSRLIPDADAADRALQELVEYRLPKDCSRESAQAILRALSLQTHQFPVPSLDNPFTQLNIHQIQTLKTWSDAFLAYEEEQYRAGREFDFSDCSLGNIFFVGCYLLCQQSFNQAVERFSAACRARGRVLNLTDGQNLVLVGLKENGAFLPDEAHIVSEQEEAPIEDLFLLPSYLDKNQWVGRSKDELKSLLISRHQTPALNPEAEQALRSADIIIYGPGTQHSSLFPSYLTRGVAETIAANTSAEKIFIGNIQKDVEIRHETAETLIQKFFAYLNRKKTLSISWQDLVTLFFLQDPSYEESRGMNVVAFDPQRFPFPASKVIVTNWTMDASSHSGGRVLDEVLRVVNTKLQTKLQPFRHTLSIVVPGLNEERTVKKVLRELTLLNFDTLGLGKEVLYIDGGSRDESVALAQSVPDVKIYSLKEEHGRGAALRLGIQKAGGDIIAFFPSDGEYEPKDLLSVVQVIARNEFEVVYGSRSIKCLDLAQRIRKIYKGNYFLYLSSKYGGMLISILSLLLFNRFISDPYSGIKAFDAERLRGLELTSTGFEIETEILGKLGRCKQYILEVPVDYFPRSRSQGKKTTFWDGMKSVFTLLKLGIRGA